MWVTCLLPLFVVRPAVLAASRSHLVPGQMKLLKDWTVPEQKSRLNSPSVSLPQAQPDWLEQVRVGFGVNIMVVVRIFVSI